MCLNCAFSFEGKPSTVIECQICKRNPVNASCKFTPVTYKGHNLDKPIDMYISKEFMNILIEELKKMYEEGLRRGTSWHDTITYFPKWTWTQSFYVQKRVNSNNTLDCFIVHVPTVVQVNPYNEKQLKIAENIGEMQQEKKCTKIVPKFVGIDVEEILKVLDGMEVGESS